MESDSDDDLVFDADVVAETSVIEGAEAATVGHTEDLQSQISQASVSDNEEDLFGMLTQPIAVSTATSSNNFDKNMYISHESEDKEENDDEAGDDNPSSDLFEMLTQAVTMPSPTHDTRCPDHSRGDSDNDDDDIDATQGMNFGVEDDEEEAADGPADDTADTVGTVDMEDVDYEAETQPVLNISEEITPPIVRKSRPTLLLTRACTPTTPLTGATSSKRPNETPEQVLADDTVDSDILSSSPVVGPSTSHRVTQYSNSQTIVNDSFIEDDESVQNNYRDLSDSPDISMMQTQAIIPSLMKKKIIIDRREIEIDNEDIFIAETQALELSTAVDETGSSLDISQMQTQAITFSPRKSNSKPSRKSDSILVHESQEIFSAETQAVSFAAAVESGSDTEVPGDLYVAETQAVDFSRAASDSDTAEEEPPNIYSAETQAIDFSRSNDWTEEDSDNHDKIQTAVSTNGQQGAESSAESGDALVLQPGSTKEVPVGSEEPLAVTEDNLNQEKSVNISASPPAAESQAATSSSNVNKRSSRSANKNTSTETKGTTSTNSQKRTVETGSQKIEQKVEQNSQKEATAADHMTQSVSHSFAGDKQRIVQGSACENGIASSTPASSVKSPTKKKQEKTSPIHYSQYSASSQPSVVLDRLSIDAIERSFSQGDTSIGDNTSTPITDVKRAPNINRSSPNAKRKTRATPVPNATDCVSAEEEVEKADKRYEVHVLSGRLNSEDLANRKSQKEAGTGAMVHTCSTVPAARSAERSRSQNADAATNEISPAKLTEKKDIVKSDTLASVGTMRKTRKITEQTPTEHISSSQLSIVVDRLSPHIVESQKNLDSQSSGSNAESQTIGELKNTTKRGIRENEMSDILNKDMTAEPNPSSVNIECKEAIEQVETCDIEPSPLSPSSQLSIKLERLPSPNISALSKNSDVQTTPAVRSTRSRGAKTGPSSENAESPATKIEKNSSQASSSSTTNENNTLAGSMRRRRAETVPNNPETPEQPIPPVRRGRGKRTALDASTSSNNSAAATLEKNISMKRGRSTNTNKHEIEEIEVIEDCNNSEAVTERTAHSAKRQSTRGSTADETPADTLSSVPRGRRRRTCKQASVAGDEAGASIQERQTITITLEANTNLNKEPDPLKTEETTRYSRKRITKESADSNPAPLDTPGKMAQRRRGRPRTQAKAAEKEPVVSLSDHQTSKNHSAEQTELANALEEKDNTGTREQTTTVSVDSSSASTVPKQRRCRPPKHASVAESNSDHSTTGNQTPIKQSTVESVLSTAAHDSNTKQTSGTRKRSARKLPVDTITALKDFPSIESKRGRGRTSKHASVAENNSDVSLQDNQTPMKHSDRESADSKPPPLEIPAAVPQGRRGRQRKQTKAAECEPDALVSDKQTSIEHLKVETELTNGLKASRANSRKNRKGSDVEKSQVMGNDSGLSKTLSATKGKRSKKGQSTSSTLIEQTAGSSPAKRRRRTASISSAAAAEQTGETGSTVRLMFTGISDTLQYEQIAQHFNALIETDIHRCTHLITDHAKRTIKFLCAVAQGLPILTSKWLLDSRERGQLQDIRDYWLVDKESEKTYDYRLETTLQHTFNGSRLLQGLKVFVTKKTKPPPNEIKDIVVAAGGTFLPSLPKESKSDKKDTLVISCDADKTLYRRHLTAGYRVVSNEVLLTGILQHRLDIQKYAFS